MAALLEYKCPCCGGAIAFDSSVQKMKCPYCDTEFEMDALRAQDEALRQEQEQTEDMSWDTGAGSDWQPGEADGMRVYTCKSCGGEIVGDENTGATACPYCGNPVVMTGAFTGALRPDLVIPFQLDKEAAKKAFAQHLQGKRLLPKAFKDENHIDEVKGVYVPFWLFNAEADADLRYRATRVHSWSDSNYDYTETQYFSVLRSGSLAFDNVPVDGSSKMADDLMESIEPFDLRGAVDFQTAYLAGYLADKYDVTAEESINRANQRIRESTEDAFRGTVQGYATVMPEHSNLRLKNGRAKYALYPVWLLNTSWQGKKYTFAMNGQTGKFVGNLPMDKGAFWKWFWGVTAAVTAAVYGLMWLVHLL